MGDCMNCGDRIVPGTVHRKEGVRLCVHLEAFEGSVEIFPDLAPAAGATG